jgi:peptidoglycan hydrolase-like protein with peptidoglycan-binding domain
MSSFNQPLRSRWRTLLVICALAAPACAGNADNLDESREQKSPAASSEDALRIGDSGPEVQHVNQYLAHFGYFPNAELTRQYPTWHPVVLEAPANESVFDENTELAVRAFQRSLHLTETGMVDAETRAAMDAPRCGVPDSAEAGDDKWALFDQTWGTSSLTYSVNTSGTPEGRASVFNTQVDTAFAAWTARSGYTATRDNSGNGNIKISWANLGGVGTNGITLGQAGPTNSGNPVTGYTLQLNNNAALAWSFADEPLNPGGAAEPR